MSLRGVLALVVQLAALSPALATAHSTPSPAPAQLELTDGRSYYPVTEARMLVDQERLLSVEQVRRLEGKANAWSTTRRFNFGYSPARRWLKVVVSNRGARSGNWLLELGYPMIQKVEFYQYLEGREVAGYKTGRLLPFSSRPIGHHNFLFEFAVPGGASTELYLMVESNGTVFAPLSIATQEALMTKSIRTSTAVGIYVGIILAMALYNLFLLFAFRDRNYLYYVVYAATFCLLLTSLNGMSYQYLWPDWPAWNKVSVPVLVGISYLFLALFTKSFLETKRLTPRFDVGLNVVIAGALFLIIGGLFSYGLFVNRFTSLFISIVPLIVIPVSARCAQLGSRPAVYYLVAFSCFFIGSGTHAARDLGWLPQNFVTANGPYLGSAAEMLFLSLGLAARIKTLREDLDRQLAISAFAAQVAHDIKSPLAALAVVEKDLTQLAEGRRIMVRSAIGRIRDIANSLVEKDRGAKAAIAAGAADSAAVELLSSHIDALLTEKRLQFRSMIGVEIEANQGADSYGLFARINPAEFKRDLSNLINNAVEAVGEKGRVTIDLSGGDGEVVIRIQDDGKGVPPEVLARLGERGVTHGKPGGHGLGIHRAKANAVAWGGSLEITSEAGGGTTVALRLPRAKPPAWFVAKLDILPGGVVAVLDDDASIHQVWRSRFNALRLEEKGVVVLHFSRPNELRAWRNGNPDASRKALYLTDYELLGHAQTGLALIAEFGLGSQTILVTSRFEEKAILDECLRLKARMIPKGLAGFVPIAVPATPDAVLLDDDLLVHMAWEIAAESRGLRFLSLKSREELLANAEQLPKNTPIYLDSELGDGVHGMGVAEELHVLGFSELYLATGHAPESFPQTAYIKRIVGKEPPWT